MSNQVSNSNTNSAPITLTIARERNRQGFNLIPIADGSKRPDVASWKQWQSEHQTDEFLTTAFARPREAYAIVTGSISGNLVAIDFDCDGIAFDPFMERLAPQLRDRLVVESSRSGKGRHIFVRLMHQPGGSEVFARAANGGHVLIETRAEGGYLISTPSVGQTILQGSFDNVPVLTDEEYNSIVSAARSLDERHENDAEPVQNTPTAVSDALPLRPGDIYNRQGSEHFAATITQLGWQRIGGTDTDQRWRRPGKTSGSNSATLRLMPDEHFWVWHTFSSETVLPPNRSMAIFTVYAKLVHNGDFGAAARHLASEGFCETPPAPVIQSVCEPEAQTDQVPEEASVQRTIAIPRTGLIGKIADYTDSVSPRQNPTLSSSGALAFMAHAAGIGHYRSQFGDRPNLYIAALAPSTIGKSFPLKTNRRIARALNIDTSVASNIASGPGLEDAVACSPRALLIHLDEFQKQLGQMTSRETGSALAQGFFSTLLQVYSASSDIYTMRKMSQRGQRQNNKSVEYVQEPHVTVAAFGIAEYVFQHLTAESIADGLLGRFLIFMEDKRGPRVDEPIERNVPNDVLSPLYYLCHGHEANRPSLFPESFTHDGESRIVNFDSDAAVRRKELLAEEDRLYDAVSGADGEGRRALIGRTFEKAMKLALVFAVSDNPDNPHITLNNVDSGWQIALNSTNTLLSLTEKYTARNRFDELNKRIKRICRDYGKGGQINKSMLVRHMHESSKDVEEVLITMQESGEITVAPKSTAGRTATVITLIQ